MPLPVRPIAGQKLKNCTNGLNILLLTIDDSHAQYTTLQTDRRTDGRHGDANSRSTTLQQNDRIKTEELYEPHQHTVVDRRRLQQLNRLLLKSLGRQTGGFLLVVRVRTDNEARPPPEPRLQQRRRWRRRWRRPLRALMSCWQRRVHLHTHVNLRTSILAGTFTGSIWTQAHYKFWR